jgi:WD40 repeat protein
VRLDFQNPWPGLDAYDEASHSFFHGRGEEAAELLRVIRMAPLSVVYGKSGLGKSSLLQAGLFPLLRTEHYLPIYVRVDFSSGRADPPLDQARRRLKDELDGAMAEYPAFGSDESLWEYLHRKDLEIWSKDNFPLTPVLVFDQFEELFSRSGGNVELIRQVFDSLADLIENRLPTELATAAAGERRSRLDVFSQRYRLVLSFREDFLPEVQAWEKAVPSLLRNYLRLGPMSRQRAINAVEQAGREVLDQGVGPAIVDFVGKRDHAADATDSPDMVIEPVLLSLCCSQLNRRRGSAKINQALVDSAGQNILDSFYRDALADDEVRGPPDVASFIEEHLIQGDHYRGDYPIDEAFKNNLLTAQQLAPLTDRHRLLRKVQHPDTARVELIHDRLVPVVRKARDERKIRQHQDDLQRQADGQRKRAEDQERAASRLLRALWRARVFTAVAVGATVAAGFYAWRADNLGALASARSLTAAAINQSQSDSELGVLLALHAAEAAKSLPGYATREVADVLGRTIGAARLRSSKKMDGPINKAAFSPDQKRLLVSLEDNTLHLLRWPEAQEEIPVQGQDGKYWAPRFAPTGQYFSALAVGGSVRIWNAETGKVEQDLTPPGSPAVLRFSPDGTMLAVGGNFTAWVWHLGEEKPFLTLDGHKNQQGASFSVTAVAFNPTASLIATGALDDTVRFWDLRRGTQVGLLRGHTAPVEFLEFSADGQELLSASQDSTVRIWNVATGVQRATLHGHANSVFSACYSQDQKKIVTAGADSTVRIWDADSGREIARLSSHSQPVAWANFAGNDRLVVSASWDGTIRTWDASGHTGKVESLEFSPDGRVVGTAGNDGTIRLWDAVSGEERRVLATDGTPVTSLRFSRNGEKLASGDASGRIQVWNPATGENVGSLPRRDDGIENLAWSPDGTQLLSAAKSAGTDLWNVTEMSLEQHLVVNYHHNADKVAFSPNGQWIAATTADGMLWIWRSADPKEPRKLLADQGKVFCFAFAPDSGTIMTGGYDRRPKLWDVASGQNRTTLADHGAIVTDGVFTPDSLRLITSSLKGEILVWDATTGQSLPGPSAHAGNASLGISADGTRLATFSWDRTAKVWDTRSWRELATLTHRELVDGGAISPDGTRIATFTPYDGVRIVPLDLAELVRLAKNRVTRDLTREECRQYLRREDCPSLPK